MITIRIRSAMWFAAGAAVALVLAAVFVGRSANADPGADETTFVPITPCRLFDTRPAPNTVGQRSSPIGAGDTHTQEVHGENGDCEIPTSATAIALNVTAINATATSFLTIYPTDADLPLAANLNYTAGAPPTPNKVDVKLSADGRINIYNEAGTVNVAADVAGYYTNSGIQDLQAQIDALAAPKQRTVVLSGRSQQYRGGTVGSLNGCEWTGTDVRQQHYFPLPVPLGATLIDVEATVFDTFSSSYTVKLFRETLRSNGGGGFDTTELDSASGGDLSIVNVVHVLTPPEAEVVGEFDAYVLQFDPKAGSGATGGDHSLCRVAVTYVEP